MKLNNIQDKETVGLGFDLKNISDFFSVVGVSMFKFKAFALYIN